MGDESIHKGHVASIVAEHILADSEVQNGPATDSDRRLQQLGYKVEFRREMSLFGVLGISFCAIGILTGMSSAFQTGLFSGGPLGLFWGWNVSCSLYALQCLCSILTSDSQDMQPFHAFHCLGLGRDL
jgi:hypothetical protein